MWVNDWLALCVQQFALAQWKETISRVSVGTPLVLEMCWNLSSKLVIYLFATTKEGQWWLFFLSENNGLLGLKFKYGR
jgi:hypothetical protein